MNVEWSDDALADLDRFSDFLRRTYPALAKRVAHEIISKAEILAQYPRTGRPIAGREEYRQIVLQILNARYVFQYRYDGERLVILREYEFSIYDSLIVASALRVGCSILYSEDLQHQQAIKRLTIRNPFARA